MINQTALTQTILAATNTGPAACERLAELADQIVADSGGGLSAEEKRIAALCEVSSQAVTAEKRKGWGRDIVAGLVGLARTVPGAETRIVALASALSTGNVAALGGVQSSTRLTSEERRIADLAGVSHAATLKAKQQIADRASSR